MNSAPLLTKEMADAWIRGVPVLERYEVLKALADGRTVNVRVMSEDECRAEYAEQFLPPEVPNAIQEWHWLGYIACARAMGCCRE